MKRICMLAILPLVSGLAACGSPGFDANYAGRDGRAGAPLSPVVVGGPGAPGGGDDYADALMLLPPEAGAVTPTTMVVVAAASLRLIWRSRRLSQGRRPRRHARSRRTCTADKVIAQPLRNYAARA